MSVLYSLEFEKPLAEVEAKIGALDALATGAAPSGPAGAAPIVDVSLSKAEAAKEAASLRKQHQAALKRIYANLSPWDTVRVARHPKRPQFRDYAAMICKEFVELHGDRRYGDDPAIVTGFGRIGAMKCLLLGHHKGRDTRERLECNFGSAHPEGYRKALLKMKLAEKFGLPIVTLVDTPGAYPGVGAEQRGQAEAIAVNLREMARLKTPIVSIIIGEGGSGGALGIAVADRVAMLEHSWYSVISPEGCAAILWKKANDQTNNAAARALNLTARDNKRLGIIDEVIKEPIGGAHRDPRATAAAIEEWILSSLAALRRYKRTSLPDRRYKRYRSLGSFGEVAEGG